MRTWLLYGLSVLGTIGVPAGAVYLSWYCASMGHNAAEPAPRLRLYLAATTKIPAGTAVRDEHVNYRVGRITVRDPIPHRSEALGHYARDDIAEGAALTYADVSVVAEAAPTTDGVLVAVPVKAFYATHLVVGMRLAFARAPEEDEEDEEEDEEDENGAPTQGNTTATPPASPRKDVLGFDAGFPLVALSTSSGDSAVAVLEVLVPRDEGTMRDLASGEWSPVVVAYTSQ